MSATAIVLATLAYLIIGGTATALVIRAWNDRDAYRPEDLLVRALVAGVLWPVLLVVVAVNQLLNTVENRRSAPWRTAAGMVATALVLAVAIAVFAATPTASAGVTYPPILPVSQTGELDMPNHWDSAFRVRTGDADHPFMVCVASTRTYGTVACAIP